jgi:hypothetical protein
MLSGTGSIHRCKDQQHIEKRNLQDELVHDYLPDW